MISDLLEENQDLRKENEKLKKKLAIAIETLKFYSDDFGYDYDLDDPCVCVYNEGKCLVDGGDKALKALKEIEEI